MKNPIGCVWFLIVGVCRTSAFLHFTQAWEEAEDVLWRSLCWHQVAALRPVPGLTGNEEFSSFCRVHPGEYCEWAGEQVSNLTFSISAVFIMAAGLLVYPFGLNSSLVRSFCGESDIYYAGECQIGWGYMLAIVGVMLTVFLPFFAKYAPKEQLSPTPLPTLL